MMGPKKQDFWPKINILKGNHCILRIRGAPVRQKLGMILENKAVSTKYPGDRQLGTISKIPAASPRRSYMTHDQNQV